MTALERVKSLGPPAVTLLVVMAFWEIAPGRVVPLLWMSPPSSVAVTLWAWIKNGSIFLQAGRTLSEMLIGFAIGAGIALASALVLGTYARLGEVVVPFFTALYSLPKIALAPLFVLMFGVGLWSKVALVAFTVFFFVFHNALDGLRSVDRDLLGILRLMGGSRLEGVRFVQLPFALGWILSGMRVSITHAFMAAVVGEIISSNRGLGFLIQESAVNFDTNGLYASLLVIMLLAVALNAAIGAAERRNARWRNVEST
jgi:NitT/TauT family transport system permease protein